MEDARTSRTGAGRTYRYVGRYTDIEKLGQNLGYPWREQIGPAEDAGPVADQIIKVLRVGEPGQPR